MDTQNDVQNIQGASPETAVQNKTSAAEVDLVAEYEKLLQENARMMEERDNYKKGMLSAKAKLKHRQVEDYDDDAEPVDEEERIAAIARKVYLDTEAARLEKQKEEAIQKLLKENRELKLREQSRSQISSAAGSAAPEKEESSPSPWSKEQIAELKRRGLDPMKVFENFKTHYSK